MTTLTLTSSAFGDGDRIPDRYGYGESNVNPPLKFGGVPDEADALALVVDDPDAVDPVGKVWEHWIVWNISSDREEIPEDWDPDADVGEGTNDFGERGYGGPNPPDREHTYRFRLFALESSLDLGSEADADDLESAAEGRVIETTTLEGTYPV